jgi:hypothetical protein
MKAELLLFGMHFNMAPRANRRRLMALIYAAFAALMAAGWFVDRWRLWSTSLVSFSAGAVGRRVVGG